MKLSIVTTLYRSTPYIADFHRRISAQAKKITDDYEIVMVDDGSPDDSLETALTVARSDSRLRIVELSRNFGHHRALMAGMDYARGELVFLIDVDLEEPPELLGAFYEKLQDGGWDVVYGCQEERQGGFVKRQLGKLAWHLINRLYSIDVPLNHCTVRLMRHQYVKALLSHRERNTVIGGLWVITGFRQVGMLIAKGNRGQSAYDFWSRLGTFVSGMVSFSTVPLRLMVYLGMLLALISFVSGFSIMIRKIFFNVSAGWSSIMVSIWFIGGAIIFCLGIIGIYIAGIFIETKNRPYVIVRNVYGD